jgi:hypothetical protein
MRIVVFGVASSLLLLQAGCAETPKDAQALKARAFVEHTNSIPRTQAGKSAIRYPEAGFWLTE